MKENKGGRPTKYDPKYCEELVEYFNIEPYFETPVDVYDKKGNLVESKVRFIAADLPTLAGFCGKIGIHRDTLHQWSKDHKEFSDSIKRAKEYQEKILVTNAMRNDYNSTFSIFFAKNNLGWSDKQEVDMKLSEKPKFVIGQGTN